MLATVPIHQLIEDYKKDIKREQVAAELLTRYGRMIYSTLQCQLLGVPSSEIDDLYQEVWLKVFQRLHQLEKPEAFGGWSKQIAYHTAIDYSRKKHVVLSVIEDTLVDSSPGPLELAEEGEASLRLQKAVHSLPEHYRRVIILFYWNQWDYQTISQSLKIPIGTVMSRLYKGKQRLNKLLSNSEFQGGV